MPPMLPIRNTDINTVIHRSPYVFPSLGLLTPHTAIANGICSLDGSLTLTNLSIELYAWRVARRVFSPFTPLDVVVAVLPQGAISGMLTGEPKDGANTKLHRAVIFIDETKPSAVHHEICHSFGLWTGVEQYDAHPSLGLPLQGMTAFATDSYGRFARSKIRHFGTKGLFWSDESYYDIMGTGITSVWTLHQTARDFYFGLVQQLGTKATREDIKREPVREGTKRIYINGLTEKFLYTDPHWGSSFYKYRMVPGSMRAFVLNDVSDASAPPPASSPQLDECELAAIDNDFNIKQFLFGVNNDFQGLPVDVWSNNSYFSATFDVPENTRFFRIRRMSDGVFPIRAQSDSLTLEILKPYPNQMLESDTIIEWVDTQTGGLGEAGTDNIAPILHNILISRDGGTTWEPIMESIQGSSYPLNTDLIPGGDNISLRIVSSDGIRNAFAQVDGLRIPNRAPRAWINSPLNGDAGDASTEWRLSAGAYDIEDEWLVSGTWTSSIDGVLGQGESLEDIHLTVGDHVLKYEVADSEGLKGSASVNVSIRNNQNMDLALNEQSLQLKSWKFSEQFKALPSFLTRETTYTLGLNLRSMGVETTHTLKLFLKKQGQAEILLASQKFFQPPFGNSAVSTTLIPNTKGDYRFRGVVEDILPTDPNPANNQYIWTLKVLSGPDLALNEYFVDFGLTTQAGTKVRRDYIIGNRGDANLIIQNYSITGAASKNFAIASAPVPGSAVKPGEDVAFSFDYLSITGGSQNAKFTLQTNDPFKPVITVDLSGACNESRLIEIRKISDYLLGRIVRSEAFDANTDGVVNIADVVWLMNKE